MTSSHDDRGAGLEKDLDRFGLSAGDDSWIDLLRVAEAPLRMGRLGGFELLSEARGGQGVVYRAVQPGTRRHIALKRLAAGALANETMRRRFEREIEAASSLNHPNIVTIYGCEIIDDQPLLTMEWIDGLPVTEWIQGTAPNRAEAIIDLFLKICSAVQHAHQRGVIHRDLKPSNILVDAAGEPHVLDFGLAKFVRPDPLREPSLQLTAQFVGTLAYAAPEQIGAVGDIDVRTDVYALGVLLYELLTGRVPFALDQGLAAAVRGIESADPERPSRWQPGLGAEIDAIVLKALCKNKDERYQSVEALAEDLRRHRDGELVLAHPPSTLYELRKLVRRHRLPFYCATAIFVVVAVCGAGAAWLWQQALTARSEEAALRRSNEYVNHFLSRLLTSSIFPDAGDEAADGDELTVREVLDRISASIHSEYGADPVVRADVHHTLGSTYLSIGRYAEAREHLEAGLTLHRLNRGPRHVIVANSLNRLGLLEERTGHYDRARELITQALDIVRSEEGELSPPFAEYANNLGMLHHRRGDHDAAEELVRRALQIREAINAPPEAKASALANLASIQSARGQYAEAEGLYRKALDQTVAAVGDEHLLVAQRIESLGRLLAGRGRFLEAERCLREALRLNRQWWGDDNHRVGRSLTHLANLVRLSGAAAGAEPLMREALQLNRSVLGDRHPDVVCAMNELGRLYFELGRQSEAEALLKQAHDLGCVVWADDDPNLSTIRANLGALLYKQGHLAAAERLMREFLRSTVEQLGWEHPEVARAVNNLGMLLMARSEYAHAEPLLDEALQRTRQTLGNQHPTTALRLRNLATVYAELGRLPEAERCMRTAVDIQLQLLPPEHPGIIRDRNSLGVLLTRLGRFEQAEALLLHNLELLQSANGPDSPSAAGARERLAQFYEVWNKPGQAAKYRGK